MVSLADFTVHPDYTQERQGKRLVNVLNDIGECAGQDSFLTVVVDVIVDVVVVVVVVSLSLYTPGLIRLPRAAEINRGVRLVCLPLSPASLTFEAPENEAEWRPLIGPEFRSIQILRSDWLRSLYYYASSLIP